MIAPAPSVAARGPRRVLLTADPLGGVWTYATALARGLAGSGVHVTLAVSGGPLDAARRAELAAIPGLVLFTAEHRLEWMDDPWASLDAAGAWLLEIEREVEPDLVHVNQFAPGALPWRAPVVVAAHSCVCSWWRAVHGTPAPPEWDRYRRAVRAGLDGAALVIAPSRAMLEALVAEHGPVRAACVVPNGLDPSAFTRGPKREFVLGAGRVWDAAKNLAALDDVAPRLAWPVAIAGDTRSPDGRTVTLTNARALGRLDRPALRAMLAEAAIFALPALYEPFGLGPLEAALSGCALVLGDLPSLREVWSDAAAFVAPHDREALARTLAELIADSGRRETLARRARARALGFSAGRMALTTLEAYRATLAAGLTPVRRAAALQAEGR